TNPRYYHLIETFWGLTGVPMVLNTSFNENEPVVCRPAEALDCFLRTSMDVLVLGHTFIERLGFVGAGTRAKDYELADAEAPRPRQMSSLALNAAWVRLNNQ